ncbi:MAG: hypothetical protein ACR2PJ_03545 [Pseudomonadales bacterium]
MKIAKNLKTMKSLKALAFALLVAVSASALTGCGDDSYCWDWWTTCA